MAETGTGRRIPLVDLTWSHRQIHAEAMAAVSAVIEGQRFIHGPEVAAFEKAMAQRLDIEFALGVSSGTDALLMTLMALGIGPGDEVITTPFSFVATAEIIRRVGARPVFADVRPHSLCLNPEAVRRKMSPRTKLLLPVHLYGNICDMDALAALSLEREVNIVEDCAQSMGARRQGRAAGAFGVAGAFSFFPSKNLGAWGDGGLITTHRSDLAERLRQIRDHGAVAADRYDCLGGNFRLDTLQAAVLLVKLKYLDNWLQARQQAAKLYEQLFVAAGLASKDQDRPSAEFPVLLPWVEDESAHVFNLFVVQVQNRAALRAQLDQAGIDSRVYYSMPLHLQACFADLGYHAGDFPVAELAAKQVLALPLFPGIASQQQEQVVENIAAFYRPA